MKRGLVFFVFAVVAAFWLLPEREQMPDWEEPTGGPALARRLTAVEYDNTLKAVFGTEVPIVLRHETPLRSHGLIAAGTSEVGFSAFSAEQYYVSAQAVAEWAMSSGWLAARFNCLEQTASFDRACAQTMSQEIGQQLIRRPLTTSEAEEVSAIADRAANLDSEINAPWQALITSLLMHPEFLWRVESIGEPIDSEIAWVDDASMATRLAFFLTAAPPDIELMRAAQAGALRDPERRAAEVSRLMQAPTLRRAVRVFFEDMLVLGDTDGLLKDPVIYPAFVPQVALDAKEQTLKTIEEHVLDLQGDYRDLFTTQAAWVTRPLGVVYRMPVPTRLGWERQEFSDQSQRLGIQSHIAFLAAYAHPGRSSATLRGAAIREVFLCQEVPDPPADVNFALLQETGNHALPTARDRLQRHREDPSCMGCHAITDPVGLSLENFDGAGSFRTSENNTPIDATGSLDGRSYEDPTGLAYALRNHPETPRCLVEKMYRYAAGRDTEWLERAYLDGLVDAFADSGFQVTALMSAIANSDQFYSVWTETLSAQAH